MSRLQSDVAGVRRTLAEGGTSWPPEGASILSRYITRVRNSFQNLGPPIPETPELTEPGIVETPASGESGPSSPAHVLVHREQESEAAGDLPQKEDLGIKEGS